MGRAEDLFARLRYGGLSALDQLIADREPESLFLDFKGAADGGVGTKLGSADNKNLSKAVSGFGNSEGGLLIWGVDCRRDPKTGDEVAAKQALADAAGFRTKLEGAISRVTLPPHATVESLTIIEADGLAGYVVQLIPKAHVGPLRAVVTDRYHLRAGSDFGIVPHDVLAGMFGRSPQPKVTTNFMSHPARLDGGGGSLVLSIGILAANIGAVLAERPFLSIWYGDLPSRFVNAISPIEGDYVKRQSLCGFGFVANPALAIPPSGAEYICDVVLELPVKYSRQARLDCTLGVAGAAPLHFFLEVAPEDIAKTVATLQRKSANPTSSDCLKPIPMDHQA